MNYKIMCIILIFMFATSVTVNSLQYINRENLGTFVVKEVYVTNVIYFEKPMYKIDRFQNYSNDEVRKAINYSVKYVDNPGLLMELDFPAWVQWLDYESRVDNASYLYWVISYAFNI